MKSGIKLIKYENEEYWLIGDEFGGSIAKKDAYQNGEVSYAHLMEGGDIMRYGDKIGTLEDITIIRDVQVDEVDVAGHAVANILFGDWSDDVQ